METKTGVKTELTARIIKADGTIEELGVIATSDQIVETNKINKVKKFFKKKKLESR